MNITQILNWRYATKNFNPDKKISTKDFETLLESLRLAPSSYNIQSWKFINVESTEKREEIYKASYNQEKVLEADKLIVLVANENVSSSDVDDLIDRTSEVRGVDRKALEGFETAVKNHVENNTNQFLSEWSRRQLYIALGFLLFSAAALEIDSCPMEGFIPEKVNEILELDEDESAVAMVALGYRADNDVIADLEKVRFSKDEVIKTV